MNPCFYKTALSLDSQTRFTHDETILKVGDREYLIANDLIRDRFSRMPPANPWLNRAMAKQLLWIFQLHGVQLTDWRPQ